MKCPQCDFENEEGGKFCKNCNIPLSKQDYSEDNPYINKRENKDQTFELISDEEVKAETEGGKYKRLNLEYVKLLENPNSNFDLIKKYMKITNNIEKNFSNRNLKGIKLEKEGKIDEAIELYEKNVNEEFYGSHPYERLAIIYRKKGLFDDEIRVLKKAKGKMNEEKLKRRLEKVKKIVKKQKIFYKER